MMIDMFRQSCDGGKDLNAQLLRIDNDAVIFFKHHDQFENIDGIEAEVAPDELGIHIDIRVTRR